MAGRNKPAEPEKDPTAAPGWALTFGDLMTQLLTFFILLFSVSEVKKDKVYDTLKAFRTRVKLSVPFSGYTIKSVPVKVPMALSQKSTRNPDKQGSLGEAKKKINAFLTNIYMHILPKKNVSVKRLIALKVYFEPGRSILRREEKEKLEKMADALWGYRTGIKIVGYTAPDALPINSGYSNNFMLGQKRADTVRDYLMSLWIKSGHSQDIRRLESSTKGSNGEVQNSRQEYDRVEIIDTGKSIN